MPTVSIVKKQCFHLHQILKGLEERLLLGACATGPTEIPPGKVSVTSCRCSADVPSCMEDTPVAGPLVLKLSVTRPSLLNAIYSVETDINV